MVAIQLCRFVDCELLTVNNTCCDEVTGSTDLNFVPVTVLLLLLRIGRRRGREELCIQFMRLNDEAGLGLRMEQGTWRSCSVEAGDWHIQGGWL